MSSPRQQTQPCADSALPDEHAIIGRSLVGEPKLTLKQAALAMGISVTTLRRLVAYGEIPVIQYDGRVVFLTRDIDEYLEGRYGRMVRAKHVTQQSRVLQDVLKSDVLKKAS